MKEILILATMITFSDVYASSPVQLNDSEIEGIVRGFEATATGGKFEYESKFILAECYVNSMARLPGGECFITDGENQITLSQKDLENIKFNTAKTPTGSRVLVELSTTIANCRVNSMAELAGYTCNITTVNPYFTCESFHGDYGQEVLQIFHDGVSEDTFSALLSRESNTFKLNGLGYLTFQGNDLLDSSFKYNIELFSRWSNDGFDVKEVYSYQVYIFSSGARVNILKNRKGKILFAGYGWDEFPGVDFFRFCK